MPIDLTQSTAIPVPEKEITPKFFDNVLTGTGRKQGVLNYQTGPNTDPSLTIVQTLENNPEIRKKSHTNINDVETWNIPLDPLIRSTNAEVNQKITKSLVGLKIPVPDPDRMFLLGRTNSGANPEVWLDVTPQTIWFRKEKSSQPKGPRPKTFATEYRVRLFLNFDNDSWADHASSKNNTLIGEAHLANDPHATFYYGPHSLNACVIQQYTWEPAADIHNFIRQTIGTGFYSEADLNTWLDEYSLYDAVVAQATAWQSTDKKIKHKNPKSVFDMTAEDQIIQWIESLYKNYTKNGSNLKPNAEAALIKELIYLENYTLPLETYQKIFKTLQSLTDKTSLQRIAEFNLNVLVSSTLEELRSVKPKLQVPPPNHVNGDPNQPLAKIPQHFSEQQRAAVGSVGACSMAQAGAGTGKSTMILGRIDNLVNRGVDPSSIAVISFTNAAADNIKAKNPGIASMTIARMIHDIYTKTHPTHELSTTQTMVNSLEIEYPNQKFVAEFCRIMCHVEKNDEGSYTQLNNFVSQYRNHVITMLDQVKQTTLIMEQVICYQMIETMKEPDSFKKWKYLIIDEVQDTSLFEFVYILKYVVKTKMNLFIVGDSSQTLYEFRNSNPKALNTLEASGIFDTYQLMTNYRSNQPILDFANVTLKDIDANQYAKIQLQSNSLISTTADSFKKAVTLDYRATQVQKFIKEELQGIIRVTAKPWIDERIAAGEKIVFLAPTGLGMKTIETQLHDMYPNLEITNLRSDRPFESVILTNFIKKFWNRVEMVQPKDVGLTIYNEVINNLHSLVSKRQKVDIAKLQIQKSLQNWWIKNKIHVDAWRQAILQNQISRDEFDRRVKDSLREWEIQENNMKAALTSAKNNARKARQNMDAPLFVSTIHGIKGLEFDHAFILNEANRMDEQDVRRLYYVAFTRAKKSEYILSYGNLDNPSILTDYENLIDIFEQRDAQIEQDTVDAEDQLEIEKHNIKIHDTVDTVDTVDAVTTHEQLVDLPGIDDD